jgi:hypothetical protein
MEEKVTNKKKTSVAFNRAISNVYENNIFPTLSHVLTEIHNLS